MRTSRTTTLLAGLALAWAILGRGLAIQAGETSTRSRQWAVLVAVQEHDNPAFNLRFTGNDLGELRRTLRERAGLPSRQILEIDDRAAKGLRPTLATLRQEIPRFLKQAGPEDQVLVFFSGHGDVHQGQVYLVPRDYRREDPVHTGLPAGELRAALAQCRAKVKFLVLDCCHAGGTRGLSRSAPGGTSQPDSLPGPAISGEAMAKAVFVERVTGCIVLASSRADEKSWEWTDRKQGVFTYWLCRALEGGADKDGDGRLTADEVYEYVHERVSRTVTQVFGDSQSPVRLIGGDVEGVPVVLSLRPEMPESLCRRLAEHLDLEIRRQKLTKVAVLEFLQPLGRAEQLASANLPGYCAEKVRAALVTLAGSSYVVLDAQAVQKSCGKAIEVEAVGQPQAMQRLRSEAGGLEALVVGTLRRRGTKMHVQCDLVSTTDGSSLVTPSGVLPLSEDLLGDTGASFDNRQRPAGGSYSAEVVSFVQNQAGSGNPLQIADFPYRVEVWSIQAQPGEPITPMTPRHRKEFVRLPADERDPERNSPLVVPARNGESFEIRVWNRSKERVAVALLLDGVNSLGQRRERLGQAWSWVIEPNAADSPGWAIEGWHLPREPVTQPGQQTTFTMKRFQFVDVARSVAARENFGESIGLITAAFYAEDRGRNLAIGEGDEEERQLRTAGFKAGRLLGVVQIRYVDQEQLDKLLKQ